MLQRDAKRNLQGREKETYDVINHPPPPLLSVRAQQQVTKKIERMKNK